ncbi:MAG: phenylalanine--tRNA ligase subunit beta [Candidatus Pacebacteria bacterium]|nr:phenylalanine--tRNA ligase subunit beta [Candidatus Paceibacterota bacterium]
MKVVHSWLKEYVGEAIPDAKKVEELLGAYAFEIDGTETVDEESVIDVDILPNRASDSLCHRGVARELATILGVELENDPLRVAPELSETDRIQVSISAPKVCSRFTASLITGVTVKESPQWLQKRLRAIGQRSINNIVDATNYVMYAVGQPLHAYDADLFPQTDGKWKFDIRLAKEGEKVSLLAEGASIEDREIEMTGSELLIVDGSFDAAVGLAGIKGGRSTGVNADTTNLIIEAASFHPVGIRKTARGLGIVTDATKRFENEPSRELPAFAQGEIIKLILDITDGEYEGTVDEYLVKQELVSVNVSVDKVNQLLGLSLEADEIKSIIERTGAKVEAVADAFVCTAPWERTDLIIEEDYVEEVGRLNGLDNIKSVVPDTVPLTEINAQQYYGDKIREALTSVGFSEVITTSFQKKGKLQLFNALASDKSYLRKNLTKNLTDTLAANFAHTDLLGTTDVRMFEIGTVFTLGENGVTEHVSLALGARTKGDGFNQKDDTVVKVGCDSVAECLGVSVDWSIEKGVAETNLTTVFAQLPVPDSYDTFTKSEDVSYKTVSPYPAMARDIALWVKEEQSAEDVLAALIGEAGALCVRQDLFDTFSKEGRTSYAFRLVFQAKDRTLTDEEISGVMENINKLAAEKEWEVR